MLAQARLFERLRTRGAVGIIKDPLRSVLVDAVALDVAQMQRRSLRAAGA